MALLIALDQVTAWGWTDPRILGLFALCVVLAGRVRGGRAAGRLERARPRRRDRATAEFRSACIATLLMSATFFAVLLFLPQFFQKILGYSPLEPAPRCCR